MAATPAATEPVAACNCVSNSHLDTGAAYLPDHRTIRPSEAVRELQRPHPVLRTFGESREMQANTGVADGPHSTVGLLSLSKDVRWPPLLPQQNESKSPFWQPDGSFSCDWAALRAGEAFCSAVNACCVSCLSRTLGGPSEMTSALLEKLRAGAKTAIKEEVDHLIQTVKASAASGAPAPVQDGSGPSEASEDLTQQLLKHPALQAVAFLSVHERRLAVFEMWLDRWQVLSRGYQCTCGSAEATSAGLKQIASGAASSSETKTAVEELRAQIVQLREEARRAHREEETVVAEARTLSVELMKKQRQLLLATERVKALEKVRQDPAFGIAERAQQQLPPASSNANISSYKESLSFIANKCNKLANLTQLIQQQFPQPQRASVQRPSWEACGLAATAGDAHGTPADSSLLGALRELQTPHASMHSPHSLRARGSSHAASPLVQTKNLSRETRFRQPPISEDDARPRGQQKTAHVDGRGTGSPIHPGNMRGTGGVPPSSVRGVIPPASLTSPESHQRNSTPEEPGSNKRTREPEETLRGRWRQALPPAIRHAELDMDAEAAWQPVEPTTRGDPMQEAVWVDSFLRRRPEA